MKIGATKDLKSKIENQDDLSNQVIPIGKNTNNENGYKKENSKLKKLGFWNPGFFIVSEKVFSENQKFHIYIDDAGDRTVHLNFHLGALDDIRGEDMKKVIKRLNSMLEKDLNGTRIDEEDIMENTFEVYLGEGVTSNDVLELLSKDGFLKFEEQDYSIYG